MKKINKTIPLYLSTKYRNYDERMIMKIMATLLHQIYLCRRTLLKGRTSHTKKKNTKTAYIYKYLYYIFNNEHTQTYSGGFMY